MSLKLIDKKIVSFGGSRKKLQELGHEIAMMIFRHAAPSDLPDCVGSGDVTRILSFAKQMPKSWQAQLTLWCNAYTPIRFNVKNEKQGFDLEYKKIKDAQERLAWWKLEDAVNTPFYLMEEPDTVADQIDLDKLIAMVPSLAKRIQKKIDDDGIKENAIPVANAMVTTLNTLRFERPANDEEVKGEEEQAAA